MRRWAQRTLDMMVVCSCVWSGRREKRQRAKRRKTFVGKIYIYL
jgi:hypothetical protein